MTSQIYHKISHSKEFSHHTYIFQARKMQLSLICIIQWYQYSQPVTSLAYRLMTYTYKMLGRPNYNIFYNNEAIYL